MFSLRWTNSVQFILNDKHPVMESAPHIPFSRPIQQGTKVTVKIKYETSNDAVALQFLDKEYGHTMGVDHT